MGLPSSSISRVTLLALVAVLTSCSGDDPVTTTVGDDTPVATSITLSASTVTFGSLGRTLQLTATVLDQESRPIEGALVDWESSVPTVATVTGSGLVEAVANGSATITAASGSATASASVTVAQVAATVTLSRDTATLSIYGDTLRLTATVMDSLGSVLPGAPVDWSSDDTAVAPVTEGLVTALADGLATISAQSGSASATASVTVALEPIVLAPGDVCSAFPSFAIASFADANLEDLVRSGLGLGPSDDLTCGLLSGLSVLVATGAGITDLLGIQNLTGLTEAYLAFNSITDVTPLSDLTGLTILMLHFNSINDVSALDGLTGLTRLHLGRNDISDLSPLGTLTALTYLDFYTNPIGDLTVVGTLTSLTELDMSAIGATDITVLGSLAALKRLELHVNSITDLGPLRDLTDLEFLTLQNNATLSDITPLLDNPGIGAGDSIDLRFTSVLCTEVDKLVAKGVTVTSSCP